jgi:hypothetical protein
MAGSAGEKPVFPVVLLHESAEIIALRHAAVGSDWVTGRCRPS